MAKKIGITVSLLIIAAIGAFFIWSYSNYKLDKSIYKTFLLPRLELSVVEITSLTAERTDMLLKMLVKNKLPFAITTDSLVYRIYIDGVEIIRDRYRKSITLHRNDSNWISLPIAIFNKNLKEILNASKRKNKDSVEYRLVASFYTDIIFKKKFNIDLKRVLPLIYIPEMEAEHIRVDSLNFKRAAIELTFIVKNENLFAIKAKNIAYQFSIEDNKWMKGTIPGLTDVKAHDKTRVSIPLRVSFKEVGKTLFDLLKKGKDVKYKLHLTMRIEPDNQMLKNSEVILESSGTVKSLLKAIKNS